MLPKSIQSSIEQAIGSPVVSTKPVGGGSINHAARIEAGDRIYFVKWNNATRYPGMFEAEAKGLKLLSLNSSYVIPEVILSESVEGHSYLLMTFIRAGRPDWKVAGKLLAELHSNHQEQFGLDHANYIGSLPQSNSFHNSWQDFFTNERILPQMKLAVDSGALSKSDFSAATNFCRRIPEIFPNEKPSLLHGDLWSGNIMFSDQGPSIYDPAVYFGHREMDIAMTKLFGGFDEEFYEGYNEDYALEKNWKRRISFCNLYPLLVHVNLFGGSYTHEVRSILSPF